MTPPYKPSKPKNWLDELKEMNIFMVLFFLVAIVVALYFSRCGVCGWTGAQIISYKHGGLFHYDCLDDLNK
jgi:hypothetical protein